MKKVFITLLLIAAAGFAFAKDVVLYSEPYNNIYLDENAEEIFEEAVKLCQGKFNNAKSDKEKINLVYEAHRPNLYIGWSDEINPNVKFPHVLIKYEEDEYKEMTFNVEVYRSKEDRSYFSLPYYVGKLSKKEKINLFEKVINGAVVALIPADKEKKVKLEIIDSFNFSSYYPSEIGSSSSAIKWNIGDEHQLYSQWNENLYCFGPFWNREFSLTENLNDVKEIWEGYTPVISSDGTVKVVNPNKKKLYVFDKKGKFLKTESLIIPDGKPFFAGFTDAGIPLYFSIGENYFNSKLIKAGLENQPLKEYTFIQGMIDCSTRGNNGDFWVERSDGTCIYNVDGELTKVIFKSGESDSDSNISIVDKDNNFFTYNRFANTYTKYNFDGRKLWSGTLPDACKNAIAIKYKDGILIFQLRSNEFIRIREPGSKLSADFEKLVELNKQLKDVNTRSKNAECYKQLADIYLSNGGVAAAYQYLKKYLEYSPADSKARELMLDCELVLAKESIQLLSEKAIALYEEYGEETADESYKAAMKILEKYKKYYPQDEELQKTYFELKEIIKGDEAGVVKVPALEVKSVELSVLFPALMNVYACEPSGILTVKNNSKNSVKNVELKSYVRKYMDFASASDVIAEIKAGQTVEIPIKTVLNSESMNVDETVNLQMQLTLSWQENDLQKKQVITRPVTMYKKSAIVWKDTSMLSCFILPNDKSVTDFAFNAISKSEKKVLTRNISNAVLICNAVGSLPVKYIPDPQAPVAEQLGNEYAVDTVRLPFETLKLKGGDCDDLTTLLCSLLESSGISTALITTEGHIFIAFDSGLSYNSMWDNLTDGYAALDVDGQAWIPVEVTALDKGFMNAWNIACKTLMKEDFEFVTVQDSMLRYQSVSVEGSGEQYSSSKSSAAEKELDGKCFDEIVKMFVEATPVSEEACKDADELNGIAEAYFELNDIESAIRTLLRAYKIDSKNKTVVSNLAGLYKIKGDNTKSSKYEKIAGSLPVENASELKNKMDGSTLRGSDKGSSAMSGSKVNSARGNKNAAGGVKIKGKSGIVKHTKPVSSNIAGKTVAQKSVQTASSRATNINDYEWKK